MNILFITSNRVGDAVLSTGVLDWLVKTYPTAQFTVASGPYAAEMFRATPRLKQLFILRKQSWNRHWIGLWRATVGTRWDLIVDLRNSAVSRLVWRKKLMHHTKSMGLHKVVENANVLGVTPPPAPHVYIDKESAERAAQMLPDGKTYIAMGPAANWPCKQWPVERFTELAQQLISSGGLFPGATVVILADTKEREQLLTLFAALPKDQQIEIIGQSLPLAAACLKRCAFFVGNDSGLMHLSAAVGTKTLGLFGPGYEHIYGPWGAHAAYIRTPESREELLARLPHPGAHHPNLMGGLQVGTVLDAAKKLISV
jgi:lipopolysaccharide export system permease protein